MNTPKRYNPALVTLHWLTVILLFGAGMLSEGGGRSPINIHMILGSLLLIVMIARLIVRFTSPRPAPLSAGNAFFNKIGELTHLGLYLLAFFILGMGGLIAYNRNLFGYLLDNTASVTRAGALGIVHHLGWFLIIMLVFLHVGAALYHQFILKDNILSRMWYGK
ncbi:MAG: cytochrome b/b6 domain-containing protein [Anaerolineales bacterium]|nr:cytochrome b/b6 domain-containing protein [Anaerolineales bacterium]MCB9111442.1 cytochrome b/b6 domain-containing protein [Anaerolineales bacterium]